MKPHPSFSCYKKPVDLTVSDGIDFLLSHADRRPARKAITKSTIRRKDPVYFVDLKGTADYDAFFTPHLDKKMSLNTKGPSANLYWEFSKDSEGRVRENESTFNEITLSLITIFIY